MTKTIRDFDSLYLSSFFNDTYNISSEQTAETHVLNDGFVVSQRNRFDQIRFSNLTVQPSLSSPSEFRQRPPLITMSEVAFQR